MTVSPRGGTPKGRSPRRTKPPPTHVFVYGTLRSTSRSALGAPQRRCLRWCARYVGRASMRGIVIDLGGYPGVVPVVAACRKVHGEVWRITDARRLLPILDAYEGLDDANPEYTRAQTDLTRTGTRRTRGLISSWVYVYAGTFGDTTSPAA